MRRVVASAVAACVLGGTVAACGSSGSSSGSGGDAAAYTVVVAAPLTTAPWVGRFIERGAQLAVDEVNAAGVGPSHRKLKLRVVDDAGSPRTAADDARQAVADHAAAFITDGVGATAVADVSDPANLPVFVVFDGGSSIIDPVKRPTLFRIAPADQVMGRRLADYVSAHHPRPAVISDDTSYGRDGLAAISKGFADNHIALVAHPVVSGTTVTTQVLQARQAGATLLVVWASSPVVAATVRAARSSGWAVPIITSPTGEDPLVRQQLADHRDWVTGLTFVSFRITAEMGPKPFETFRAAYEKKFGAEKVGVSDGGKPVIMPPDWAMFSYDAVKLTAAALANSHAVGAPLMAALGTTVITGANGDERGFVPGVREGVSSDDMYFGRFDGFRFAPVTDDLLSGTLPSVPQ
jgi:ABC-type branched-subunit amino acid transport system substrate-binding protein